MALSGERLETALAVLRSDVAREALCATIEAPKFRGVISYEVAKRAADAEKITVEELMLLIVDVAALYAEPPISKFTVGAIAQGTTTKALYFGANMEFVGAALSFTVHAEQAATTNAWNHGEQGLSYLAVSEAPCGYCRQFLYEITTAQNLTVGLSPTKTRPVKKEGKLTALLPEAFGPNDLEVEAFLMSPANHGLVLEQSSTDPLVLEALAAANSSYAPYTKGYAGVAVETVSRQTYAGRLAENAAFNPSMSPLESALVMWNLAREPIEPVAPIQRVVLVQVDPAPGDQRSATEAVVASLQRTGPVTLESYAAHSGT
jgi:cytidine deaminase